MLVAGSTHQGEESAIIVGHDWGGAVAWYFALNLPQMTERLMICNLPDPNGLRRELAGNTQQRENSQYAQDFQKEGAHEDLTAEGLAGWVTDEAARSKYVAAFERSDFEAMLNYYKRNYPREPYREDKSPVVKVKAPVLLIHGLKDKALLAPALNNTWDWKTLCFGFLFGIAAMCGFRSRLQIAQNDQFPVRRRQRFFQRLGKSHRPATGVLRRRAGTPIAREPRTGRKWFRVCGQY